MSTALLDINVLLALLDPDHVNHDQAHDWAASGLADGWATCALTQNGLVRILSQPKYPNPLTVPAAIALLRSATADPRHHFWPCDVQLADPLIRSERLLGARQITDSYLLALAITQHGCFVTFDERADPTTVGGATPDSLLVL